MAGTSPANRVHGGLGIEYKFAPHWSVMGEWTYDKTNVNVIQVANGVQVGTVPVNYKNNNVAVGINYYFDSPYVAPAIAAAVAPVVMKKAEPVVAPAPVVVAPVVKPVVVAPAPVVVAPVPAPAAKTIFSDKPITIEGASFATGSAKLKPTASKQLDVVVDFAAKNKDAHLTVEGYTDNRGKEKANEALSAKRAEAVKAYLVKKGVDAKRISAVGKGSAKPLGDNKTEAGRAQNRRVEIDSAVRVAK
jgi:OOP family OmpA-OmpF porin